MKSRWFPLPLTSFAASTIAGSPAGIAAFPAPPPRRHRRWAIGLLAFALTACGGGGGGGGGSPVDPAPGTPATTRLVPAVEVASSAAHQLQRPNPKATSNDATASSTLYRLTRE